MKANDATITQIERFIRKIAQKFTSEEEPTIMTDIHLSISQDTGELLAFDDNDNEITRCVVSDWIDYKEPDFYDTAAEAISCISRGMRLAVTEITPVPPTSIKAKAESSLPE